MERIYDLLILGGGPCGYTAALYAARAGLDTLVLEKLAPGGQMTATPLIENYPGIRATDGFSLGEAMRSAAEEFGAKTQYAEVLSVELAKSPKRIVTDSGVLLGRAVILATGATHRPLGLPREEALIGRGVGYCATCDGMLYRGKTVAVVGGGNTAVSDALHLVGIAKEVYLIHRRDTLRAEKILRNALEASAVQVLYRTEVEALLGEDRLAGVVLCTDGERRELALDGLFISVGTRAESHLFEGQLLLDKDGSVVAGEDTRTSLDGVFAAGDLRTKPLRQIVTAAADGAVAAAMARDYLLL